MYHFLGSSRYAQIVLARTDDTSQKVCENMPYSKAIESIAMLAKVKVYPRSSDYGSICSRRFETDPLMRVICTVLTDAADESQFNEIESSAESAIVSKDDF